MASSESRRSLNCSKNSQFANNNDMETRLEDHFSVSTANSVAAFSDLNAFSGKALQVRRLGSWGTIGRMSEPEEPYRQELVHSRHVFVLWETEMMPGVADFVLNGRRVVRPGKALGSVDFRPAGAEFIANVHQSGRSERTVLTIDETVLARSSIAFQPLSGLVPVMTQRNPFLVSLLRRIGQMAQGPDLDSVHMESLALACLHEARDLGLQTMGRNLSAAPKSGLSAYHSRQLARYVDDYLASDIRLIDLANLVSLSPYYFSRSFTVAFGVSPYHYILRRRIQRAKDMMRKRDANLLEIAISVGFAGSSQFSRAFRKIEGTTPSNWRGNATQSQAASLRQPQ
jgi:AraC family transcriptional regulator